MAGAADRDAHVRASRRRQGEEALAFEQDREAMLVGQLEDVLAELEGARLDDEIYASMSPEQAQLVVAALGLAPDTRPVDDASGDDDWFSGADGAQEDEAEVEDDEAAAEEEIARLLEEIEESRRVQAALARYLELLAGPPAG